MKKQSIYFGVLGCLLFALTWFYFSQKVQKNEDYARIISEARSMQSILQNNKNDTSKEYLEKVIKQAASDGMNRWEAVNDSDILIRSLKKYSKKATSREMCYYYIDKKYNVLRIQSKESP